MARHATDKGRKGRKSRSGHSDALEWENDPRFVAAVQLIGRTGADEFQMRFSPEDEPPITWTALGRWDKAWECASAMSPVVAVFRLCNEVIDGGECQYCHRPAGFEESIEPTLMDSLICWYQWDPSTKTFQRGCSQ
jgi:hypothetical protein